MKTVIKVLCLFFSLLLVSCEKTPTSPPNPIEWNSHVRNLGKVCIQGHLYYRTNSLYGDSIAIVLDDDGKPIQCDGGIQ